MMRVVVIGAGVIGACVAYQLARSGAQVRVISGNSESATAASFGWINGSFYLDEAHHHLRCAGMAAYVRLLEQDPRLPVRFSGALCWEEQGPALAETAARLSALGYGAKVIDQAEFSTLEPDLADAPATALMFPEEGWTDAVALADALLATTRITRIQGTVVQNVLVQGGRAIGVRTEHGDIEADKVVICAGTGSTALLEPLGIALPMLKRPGVSVTTVPVSARLNHVLVTPGGEVRQLADGRLLSPAAASHQGDTAEEITDPLDVIAERTAARLAELVGVSQLSWDSVSVANRPVPQDGRPVIGATEMKGLYAGVMHSGVTLAAVTGEVLANQVMGTLTNAQADLIAPYGIERFQS